MTSLNAELRIAEGIATYDPERIRLKVIEPGADTFASGVLEMLKPFEACDKCKRTGRRLGWYRLFAKMAKLVDAPQTLILAIWQQLGVRDETEARAAIEAYKQVRGLDEPAAAEYCLETAKRYYAAQGKQVVVLAAGGASKLPSQGDAGSAMIPAADDGNNGDAR